MAIELKNVSKSFGGVKALSDVSVSFGGGKIYGLLGSNGAGKTTMLNIITNRLYADSGEVLIDGERAPGRDRALGKVYMMAEQNLFPDSMKVKAAISVTADFIPGFDTELALELGKKFGLPLNKKVKALSTGYASILRIVLALSAGTPYVIFDEPVLGLDAQHRDMFYRLLMEHCGGGEQTVIISTHLIQEAAPLIEHAVIIKDGEIIRNAPAEELKGAAHTVTGPAGLGDGYTAGRRERSATSMGGLQRAWVDVTGQGPGSLAGFYQPNGLQDYFISLMNEEGAK